MKTRTLNSILPFFIVLILVVSIPNDVKAQSLLKKVKNEIKKSKPQKQNTAQIESTSNASNSQKSSTNDTASSKMSSSRNPPTTSSSNKNQKYPEYTGRGQSYYVQIVKHLGILDNCEGNIGSTDCELGFISSELDYIDQQLKHFVKWAPEYDITELKSAYDKHRQLLKSGEESFLEENAPFEMKEYNTSSSIYSKVRFFDLSLNGSDIIFYVSLVPNDNRNEWTKKANTYIEKYGIYEAETIRRFGEDDDRGVFFITPPKDGKPHGSIQMTYDFHDRGENTGGIILFGEESPEILKSKVQKIKIRFPKEEVERTPLEKNHIGEIIFSSQKLKRTLSETNLENKFTLGNTIYSRIVLKDPLSSMRELFMKEGLSPNYQNSWMIFEYYKNGKLIGTSESPGFTGYKQATKIELKDQFDKDRSFDESLLEEDFYLFNSAAPLWRGLLEKGISNGTYKIDMKCYVVHSPTEGRVYKKFVSEGYFNLVVNEAGKSKLCKRMKICKK
ncbi:MAG: hypothetical protein AAGD17_04090 [Bacteroidota bacterium]